MRKKITGIVLSAVFSAFVCALLIFVMPFSGAAAESPYTIEAVRDYSVCGSAAEELLDVLNSEREYRGFCSFEKDSALMRTAEYEALYISQYMTAGEIFSDHPLLSGLNSSLYPFVTGRYIIISSECDSSASFVKHLAAEFSNSRGGILTCGACKTGAATVNSNGISVTVIHTAEGVTYDALPKNLIAFYKEESVAELFEEPVQTADGELPVIYGENIELPLTGYGDFYDISKYVSAYDNSGSVKITSSPAFAGSGFTGTVYVTASDASGNISTASLGVTFYESSPSQLSSGEILSCFYVPKAESGGVFSGAHMIFTCGESDGLYLFTVEKDSIPLFSALRSENYFTWNPPEPGTYTVKSFSVSEDLRTVSSVESVEFTVADGEFIPSEPVALKLSDTSDFAITDENYIIGLFPGITYGDILKDFVSAENGSPVSAELAVLGNDGENINALSTDTVCTGSVLVISSGSIEYFRLTAVIYGDITGDGVIDISDFAKMRYALLGKVTLEGCWHEAANIAGRDEDAVDISDFAMLRFKLLGKVEIPQI